MNEVSTLERIAGAMLGLACGDALGAPAQFRSRDFVAQKWGRLSEMTGGGVWVPGEWTDDTGMTLCVAEGILERPDDPVEPVGHRLLTWEKSAKDVNETVASILEAYAGDWFKASRTAPAARSGRASGNGSLMRILPVALAYPSPWQMLGVAARLSAMTHWDGQAEAACAAYCLWVSGILDGKSLRSAWMDAVDAAAKVAAAGPLDPATPGAAPLPDGFWNRLASVETLAYEDLQPSGYAAQVLECLEAVVWCCLKALDFEEAVVSAVSLGGDSDTLGALCGGAAGAYWGVASLPTRWTVYLLGREQLTEVSRQLDELRRHHAVYATPGVLPFEYFRVAENLYAGRAPLTARDIRMLAAAGVTHFIDLRSDDEWRRDGAFGEEAVDAIETFGLKRAAFPVDENRDEVLTLVYEHYRSVMDNPDAHLYIHAGAGQRRTAAVLAACLAAESMMTFDEALAHLADQLLKASGTRIESEEVTASHAREWLRRRGQVITQLGD